MGNAPVAGPVGNGASADLESVGNILDSPDLIVEDVFVFGLSWHNRAHGSTKTQGSAAHNGRRHKELHAEK